MLDFSNKPFNLFCGDSLEVLKQLPDNSVDSIVTDPPYGLNKEPDMNEVLQHWLAGDDYHHKGGGFMGKAWDSFVPGPAIWKECLRVLKPGGHLLAFFGSRTYDMGTLAIRLAGFEVRDQIMWLYGSGFPKSLDVSKAIDKTGGASVAWFGPWFRRWREGNGISSNEVAKLFPSKSGEITGCVRNWELGLSMPTPEQFNTIRDTFGLPFDSIEAAEREVIGFQRRGKSVNTDFMSVGNNITAPATDAARQWQGWGTALKPAHEPICVARKPLVGTVTANVLEYGTGALNIDGCRVSVSDDDDIYAKNPNTKGGFGHAGASVYGDSHGAPVYNPAAGRWPANVIHDGSEEVVAGFPNSNGSGKARTLKRGKRNGDGFGMSDQHGELRDAGTGSAARFFYCAKASKCDRDEGLEGRNHHPTVKPSALMQYLCRLVTPPGGIVLDPFNGSGSTGKAAMLNDFKYIGIDLSREYIEISEKRIQYAVDNKDAILGRIRGRDKTSEDKQLKMTSDTVTLNKAKQASKLNKFFDIEN